MFKVKTYSICWIVPVFLSILQSIMLTSLCTPPFCFYHSAGVRRRLRCQRGGLHHLPWLSPGVPASPELPLDHHSAGALAAHRPQLQPPLWDREAGLQVRRGGDKWGTNGGFLERAEMESWHNSDIYKPLFPITVKLLWPIRLHGVLLFWLNDDLCEWWKHLYLK